MMQVARSMLKNGAKGFSLALFLLAFPLVAGAALADEFVWAPDFPVGTAIPEISAQDQDGTVRTFDNLRGEKGLVLVLSRSFEW